ncbi:hypothetical protein WMY93_007301 [Mugilogobius chulae]|uniref:Uncharacterized protein n=1 Tax=Mugilogobius chulae TaxID=88201 RepID=A0AAW0PCU0_9GOBI
MAELTVPWKMGLKQLSKEKRTNMLSLHPNANKQGGELHFPVEVGCRGYTGSSTQRFLKTIGVNGPHLRKALKDMAEEAEQGSFWIWLRRKDKAWGEMDPRTAAGVNEQKLNCSFESGWCFWRRDPDQDQDWIRTRGERFPPETGPSVDHTTGTAQGFYVATLFSPGSWLKTFRILSLPLSPDSGASCLSFWYYMFGADVFVLRVLLLRPQSPDLVLVQRLGDFGPSWYRGQVQIEPDWTWNHTQVAFEAQKQSGMLNDIALDDITLTSSPCGPAPPEPTNVPPPTTPTPLPADCGGPFDLHDNGTFSSPNYPHYYGNKADCLWRLHTDVGKNLQLNFLDFDLETSFDTLEIRDGPEPDSTLLDPCPEAQFQCSVSGLCVSAESVCDGRLDCDDGTDEAQCVFSDSQKLQFKIVSSNFSVCSSNWSQSLSDFTCRYLGHRSGVWSSVESRPEDSPFVSVSVFNQSLETSVVDECENVVSLNCSNEREFSPGLVLQSRAAAGQSENSRRTCTWALECVHGPHRPITDLGSRGSVSTNQTHHHPPSVQPTNQTSRRGPDAAAGANQLQRPRAAGLSPRNSFRSSSRKRLFRLRLGTSGERRSDFVRRRLWKSSESRSLRSSLRLHFLDRSDPTLT